MKRFSDYDFHKDSTLAKGKDLENNPKGENFKSCAWIKAYDLAGAPISDHYHSIAVLAKVHKMKNVNVTSHMIVASNFDFEILIRHLINSVYLN